MNYCPLLAEKLEDAPELLDRALETLAGLLSREERRKVFLSCAYDH